MIEIRKAVQSYLETIHSNVFFQSAPSPMPFPVVVFDIFVLNDGEAMQTVTVDIDGWDQNPDTTTLETIMDQIDGDGNVLNPSGLNKRTLCSNGLAATFYLESRRTLSDSDPKIRRRKSIYQAHVFERSVAG